MEQLLVFGMIAISVIYAGRVMYHNIKGSEKGTCMTCNHHCSGCSQHRANENHDES